MIMATIQGRNINDNGKHTTACDGKLVDGMEQEKCMSELFRAIRDISVKGEKFCDLKTNRLFCAIEHPQRDEIDRIRTALIVYDRDTSEAMIKQTIEIMGLDYARFQSLREEYQKSLESKKGGFLLKAVGAIFIMATILALYKIFKG